MPGNRVEALEEQVAELEATVQGLTEELVEANDRIRQIEAALGADIDVALEENTFEDVEPPESAPAADDPADGEEDVAASDDGVMATEEDAAARAARSATAEQPTGLRQEVEADDVGGVDDDGDALRLESTADEPDDPARSVVEGTDAEHVDEPVGADTDKGEGDEGSDDIIVA